MNKKNIPIIIWFVIAIFGLGINLAFSIGWLLGTLFWIQFVKFKSLGPKLNQ